MHVCVYIHINYIYMYIKSLLAFYLSLEESYNCSYRNSLRQRSP